MIKSNLKRAIVVGGNHHNLLGVVRVLGAHNIEVIAIITNDTKYAYVKKSKYIKKCIVIAEKESRIIDALKDYYDSKDRPVVFPTSDFAAATIDKNYDKLKGGFVLPNIDECQGKILENMNKYIQYSIAKRCGIKMAKSLVISLNEENDIVGHGLRFPIIIKPLESIDGKKSDIAICRTEREYCISRKELLEKKYTTVIVQEFLNVKTEYCVIGYKNKDRIFIPGVIEKIRIFPKGRGSVSFGKVHDTFECENLIKIVKKFLDQVQYTGLFDIELFLTNDNTIYLNEVNYRNSGNSYIYSFWGVGLVYDYLRSYTDSAIGKVQGKKDYLFTDTYLERRQLLSGNISLLKWLKTKKKSRINFLYDKNDMKPILWKVIYAIARRIDKRKNL